MRWIGYNIVPIILLLIMTYCIYLNRWYWWIILIVAVLGMVMPSTDKD